MTSRGVCDTCSGASPRPKVAGQRLLAVDVLAGLGRGDGHRVVEVVGDAEVNGVHVRTLQQLPVVGVGVLNAELAGELLAWPLGARGNADDLGGVRSEAPQGGGVQAGDESGANHANTNDHESPSSGRMLDTMGRVYRTGLTPRASPPGPPLHHVERGSRFPLGREGEGGWRT